MSEPVKEAVDVGVNQFGMRSRLQRQRRSRRQLAADSVKDWSAGLGTR